MKRLENLYRIYVTIYNELGEFTYKGFKEFLPSWPTMQELWIQYQVHYIGIYTSGKSTLVNQTINKMSQHSSYSIMGVNRKLV